MLILLLKPTTSNGWPDNLRLGYASCSSCHADPGGGGTLTPYGRAVMPELTTFPGPEQNISEWLLYGADIRYLHIQAPPTRKTPRNFLMQADASLGATSKYVSALFTIGSYNGQNEFRNGWVAVKPNRVFTLRTGKFLPQYGIRFADHSLVTRRVIGFNQLSEKWGTDLTIQYQDIELALTMISDIDDEDIYDSRCVVRMGSAFRVAWTFNETYQLGASYLYDVGRDADRSYLGGVFFNAGWTKKLYSLFEVDQKTETVDSSKTTVGLGRLGYLFYPGMHIFTTVSFIDSTASFYDLGLKWLPKEGWELSIESGLALSGETKNYPVRAALHLFL